MGIAIDDGGLANVAQWQTPVQGSTAPDDVAGTFKTMFEVTLQNGGTVSLDFDFGTIVGIETGEIIVEKAFNGTYRRFKDFTYNATDLTAIDGFAAAANGLRAYAFTTASSQETAVRVRCAQTGGAARSIRWVYTVTEALG